jgi:hypothetical protein
MEETKLKIAISQIAPVAEQAGNNIENYYANR